MTQIKHPDIPGVTLREVVVAWSRLGAAGAAERVGLSLEPMRGLVAKAVWGAPTRGSLRRLLRGRPLRELEMGIAKAIGAQCGPEVLAETNPAAIALDFLVPGEPSSEMPARLEALRAEAVRMAATVGVDAVQIYEGAAARVATERRPMSHPSWRRF